MNRGVVYGLSVLMCVCVCVCFTGVQEKMGIMNRGVVYGLWDYEVEAEDELSFREGDCMTVLRREDQEETQWWWARCGDKEGYIPRNLLGVSQSVCLCVCVIAVEQCFPNWGTRTPRGTQRDVGGTWGKKMYLLF